MSKKIKPYILNGDGSVEWQCHKCSEPILIYKGDSMVVVVGDRGMVDGILCNQCAKPNRKETAKDGRSLD